MTDRNGSPLNSGWRDMGVAQAELRALKFELNQAICRASVTTGLLLASHIFGGNPMLALSGAGDKSSQLLRRVAVYLGHTVQGFTQEDCVRVFKMTRGAASKMVKAVEEERSDPAFNWKLSQLELLLGGSPEGDEA